VLPAIVSSTLDHARVKRPKLVIAYGFDVVTPQQRAFLDDLAAGGVRLASCGPARRAGAAVRYAALDARDEMLRAARWARSIRRMAAPHRHRRLTSPRKAPWPRACPDDGPGPDRDRPAVQHLAR
jgi:hypothetical protein